jgi:hypothetical protein
MHVPQDKAASRAPPPHQVLPLAAVCATVFPARWPPFSSCMQPLAVSTSNRGIHAVTCSRCSNTEHTLSQCVPHRHVGAEHAGAPAADAVHHADWIWPVRMFIANSTPVDTSEAYLSTQMANMSCQAPWQGSTWLVEHLQDTCRRFAGGSQDTPSDTCSAAWRHLQRLPCIWAAVGAVLVPRHIACLLAGRLGTNVPAGVAANIRTLQQQKRCSNSSGR